MLSSLNDFRSNFTWATLGQVLEDHLILGQSLDRFEEVGGQRQLVSQVSLAGLDQRIVFPQAFKNVLGSFHILAVSALQF